MMDIEAFILASAWIHLFLLFVAVGFLIFLGRIQSETGFKSISRKVLWVVGVQGCAALTALIITSQTYDDFGNDSGCLIGLAGYGLNKLALFLSVVLFGWVLIGFREYRMQSKFRFVLFLVAWVFLSFEALAIHARSLGYCIGSV